MKKLFILVSICLLASFAVQAQRVNKNGLKMVSRVFDYGRECDAGFPRIYTFQYDENDELEKVTYRAYGGTMVFKKNGDTIDINLENPVKPVYHFSCKLNEYGLIQEILTYCIPFDGSGDEMVFIEKFYYDYNGGQYRLASTQGYCKIAWKGKPREEWTYATPGNMEESGITEFHYSAPDQLMEMRTRHSSNGRVSESKGFGLVNSEYMNDTNINLCILLAGDMDFCAVESSEWCANNKEAIPFYSSFYDKFFEQQLGFDKKGNLIGLWEKITYTTEQMWRPRYMIEYVDGDPIETDQYGNDLRSKNE